MSRDLRIEVDAMCAREASASVDRTSGWSGIRNCWCWMIAVASGSGRCSRVSCILRVRSLARAGMYGRPGFVGGAAFVANPYARRGFRCGDVSHR